jgi:hypothetical protein
MKHLETVGGVELHLDEASRDIIVAVKTEIGTVVTNLTPEKACQLGIALIRESGKRYVFKPKEETDATQGNNGIHARDRPKYDPINLYSEPGRSSIPGSEGRGSEARDKGPKP